MREVAENVYALSLAWSNVYILREGERVALLDTGLQKDRPAILAGLARLGVTEKQVRQVILTHAHTDHGGNAAYFARQGAELGVHREEAPFIGLPRRTYVLPDGRRWLRPWMTLSFLLGEWLYPVERRNPTRIFEDGDVIEAPGGALRVVHCPGHTPGQCAYLREKDNVLFSGDSILSLIPITRQTALSLPMRIFSTDWAQTKRSARMVAQLRPDVLLSGHGLPLRDDTAARLLAWADALR